MLEKMGWSKGKGLGANLDGEQNFIKVSHKADQKGIGFEDRDDQWTQHEDQFNSLLKSLDNSAAPSENEDNNDDDADELSAMTFRGFGFADVDEKPSKKKKKSITETLSGKSLEEMSKNSKTRVHYKKFTRGKDLSKYSEKDLANIFGKKVTDETSEREKLEEEAAKQKAKDEPLSNYGITTVETGTTISDYFQKKKLNLLKRNAVSDETSASTSSNSPSPNDEDSREPEKKKKKKKKDKSVELPESVDEISAASESPSQKEDEQQEPQKENKKKKKKDKDAELAESVDEKSASSKISSQEENEQQESQKKKKKKRKDKGDDQAENAVDEVVDLVVEEVETKKDKKSKNKKKEVVPIDVVDLIADAVPEEESTSKKKSKTLRRETSETETFVPSEAAATIVIEDSLVTKNKKKKSKRRADTVNIEDGAASAAEVTSTNPIISNILSTLIHVNNAVDSSTEQPTSESVTSAGTKSSTSTAISLHQFAHETFEINRYQAELFRFVDLDGFNSANLSELTGYGCSKQIDLKITARAHDRNRINDLWDNALVSKYGKDVIKPKKKNQYKLKTLKNKKLFKAI